MKEMKNCTSTSSCMIVALCCLVWQTNFSEKKHNLNLKNYKWRKDTQAFWNDIRLIAVTNPIYELNEHKR